MTQLVLTASAEEKISTIRDLIRANDTGHQFTVVNVKADGTLREYKAMLKVQAGLKGGESTTAHKPNLLTVFDTTANNYRAVNLETVLLVQFGKKAFVFLDNDTAETIADPHVRAPLFSAAAITETVLRVVNKALGR